MNKRYRTKAVACIWLMTILSITGCGQKAATEGNTETQTQTEAETCGYRIRGDESGQSTILRILLYWWILTKLTKLSLC